MSRNSHDPILHVGKVSLLQQSPGASAHPAERGPVVPNPCSAPGTAVAKGSQALRCFLPSLAGCVGNRKQQQSELSALFFFP